MQIKEYMKFGIFIPSAGHFTKKYGLKYFTEKVEDLGFDFFNTTGVDDQHTPVSADENDFREYIYTAGVTDDGIGDPLDEFISFQLKIIMQGTNCAEPPRIKDLRAIALVT